MGSRVHGGPAVASPAGTHGSGFAATTTTRVGVCPPPRSNSLLRVHRRHTACVVRVVTSKEICHQCSVVWDCRRLFPDMVGNPLEGLPRCLHMRTLDHTCTAQLHGTPSQTTPSLLLSPHNSDQAQKHGLIQSTKISHRSSCGENLQDCALGNAEYADKWWHSAVLY